MTKFMFIMLMLSSLFMLSGCSLNQQKDAGGETSNIRNQMERTYEHAVVPIDEVEKTQKIQLTPHEQEVRFFENGPSIKLWSYGTGTEPLIVRAKEGDVLDVDVYNQIPQETSVHRHGIRVPNNQDGVPGITQEPIPVSGTFNYRVPLQDAGSFLFHPHINTVEQMARGLYGLLIVEPEQYPFEFDKEIVRALKDYRLNSDGSLNENFESLMDFTHGGRLGNLLTVNNIVQPTEQVNYGSTVLLRLINPSNARIYNLDVGSWDAHVVGIDGGLVAEPYEAGLIQLGPGERVDVLVNIGSKSLELIDTYFPTRPMRLASLSVVGSGDDVAGTPLQDSGFPQIPDWSSLKEVEPDDVIALGGIGVMGGDRAMTGGSDRGWTIDNGVWPDSNKQLTWPVGKLRKVRLENLSRRDHPMHLHGDFFQVLSINDQNVPWHGRKDTVNVPALGHVDLVIIPTNPGVWMFHCHIIEHAHYGMMTTVLVE